jgi:steroid 5-alpha reductase family enzyme
MFLDSLALAALVVFWYMTALFVVALARRNNSLADVAWGPAFFLAAAAVLYAAMPSGLRPVLVTILIAVWALRLAVHILLRNWGRGEDWRYAQWRGKWGHLWVLRSYLQVFLLQGFLLLIVVVPALWVNTFGGPRLWWLDGIGAALWLVGFLFEAVGDYQLARFQKDPANHGRVLRSGLWRYSRHPNYFGEVTMWWAIWLIGLAAGAPLWTVISPLVLTFLILKVSGIPLLESRQMLNPEYRDYAARTSPFFPMPPRT